MTKKKYGIDMTADEWFEIEERGMGEGCYFLGYRCSLLQRRSFRHIDHHLKLFIS